MIDTITLSIIIPTIGRESLNRTLGSLVDQGLTEKDEILVVSDNIPLTTISDSWELLRQKLSLPIKFLSAPKPECNGDYGASARKHGLSVANASHIYYLDDDDECLPSGIANIRKAVVLNRHLPHLFRMVHLKTTTLWNRYDVACGNISTQMFVHPNDPRMTGIWTPCGTGDFDFISSTVRLYDNQVIWDRAVIADHNAFR
jgi:hypothetical protein